MEEEKKKEKISWQTNWLRWLTYIAAIILINIIIYCIIAALKWDILDILINDEEINTFLNTIYTAQITLTGLSIPFLIFVIGQKNYILTLNADEIFTYLNKNLLIKNYFDYIVILTYQIILNYMFLSKCSEILVTANFLISVLIELNMFANIYNKFINSKKTFNQLINNIKDEFKQDIFKDPKMTSQIISELLLSLMTNITNVEKENIYYSITDIMININKHNISKNNEEILYDLVYQLSNTYFDDKDKYLENHLIDEEFSVLCNLQLMIIKYILDNNSSILSLPNLYINDIIAYKLIKLSKDKPELSINTFFIDMLIYHCQERTDIIKQRAKNVNLQIICPPDIDDYDYILENSNYKSDEIIKIEEEVQSLLMNVTNKNSYMEKWYRNKE